MIRHILFDLDGTLLPMDQDKFGEWSLPRLARHHTPAREFAEIATPCPARRAGGHSGRGGSEAHLPGLGRHGAKRRQRQ